jgi:hypothetical protein
MTRFSPWVRTNPGSRIPSSTLRRYVTCVSSSSISESRYSPEMSETAPRASVETHDRPPSAGAYRYASV